MFNKQKKVFSFFIALLLTMEGVIVHADTIIVSGYNYDEIGPHIILYNIDRDEYKKEYLNQQSVKIKKLPNRYCIGTYNLETLESAPCKGKCSIPADSKINNCKSCYDTTGFNPAFYNATTISPQQKAYNATPHIVYLAYFSPTCIKVGIASQKRAPLRLLEQGALAAFIIKTFPDAYQARALEEKISHSGHGIVEGVTTATKIDMFCTQKYDPKIANETLQRYLKLLGLSPESSFIDLYPTYFYNNNYSFVHTDKSKAKSNEISGEAVGMLGDIVVIRKKDKFFPIDVFYPISLKQFISYQIAQ